MAGKGYTSTMRLWGVTLALFVASAALAIVTTAALLWSA